MRTIALKAPTPESGRALHIAFSSLHPGFRTDHERKCFVSVSASSQKETLGVHATVQQHLGGRGDPITSWVTSAAAANALSKSRGDGGSP